MFETYKAFRKVVKIQQKQTELIKTVNALNKLEKINRKNEGKIQEQIVSLEKEIEKLTNEKRPIRKEGKIQESEKEIFSGKSQTEKVLQKSSTLFISKDDTRKNRLAILNAYKKYSVSIEITASHGKDNYVKPTKTENSDKFNEVTKTLESKLNGYGVRIVEFQRKYNQGGKTL